MTAPEILQNIKKLLALANEEIDKLLTLLGDEKVRTMDQYLTRKEAAFFLEVSPRTLDRRCEEGVILREEVNGRILIRKSELLKYKGYVFEDPEQQLKGLSELDMIIKRYRGTTKKK